MDTVDNTEPVEVNRFGVMESDLNLEADTFFVLMTIGEKGLPVEPV